MAQNITLLGASYSDVPAVNLPKTGGGTARFTDASPTTAVESDVTQGKIFVKADGSLGTGTNQGGGSSGLKVATATTTLDAASNTISFTGLQGEPTSFAVISMDGLTTEAYPYKTAAVVFDGTDLHGQTITDKSNAQVSYDGSNFSKNYSNGTLTITGATYFQANEYKLVYTYGGGADTEDVQVGSGATSITFTGLEDEPTYFSCIFKSNFSSSYGYQRVIAVVYDGNGIYGLEMDSEAKYSDAHWSYSYSNGSLTISSDGTNAGGYFHQPGYYQLTYAIDSGGGNYQTKTVTPTTSIQNVTADSQYDALKKVVVNPIPSQYIIPSGSQNISSNGAYDISSLASVIVNVPTGGGEVNIETKSVTNSSDQATSIQFTGLSGQPKAFFVRLTSQLTRSSNYSYYYITAMSYDGTNHRGNYYRRSNGTFYNDTTHYSHSYSNGTLTISSSAGRGSAGGSFYNGTYELIAIY